MTKYIFTFLISMIPLVELRGGVPFGITMGIKWYYALPLCMIGNMIPVPFIYFFARRILEWGKDKPVIGKFFTWCLEKGEKGGVALQEKAGKGLFFALFLFVGIPLPGTGAWTGTLAASFLKMDFKKSVIAVILGVLLAGTIMTVLSLAGVAAFSAAK
ncbi:MAG: small multi-drug export protein [Ruminococcus sp.]|nr:small multi-drug export protein [Ruminococcus sp.]